MGVTGSPSRGHCLLGDLGKPPNFSETWASSTPSCNRYQTLQKDAMSHTRSICEQTAQDTVADMHGGRRPQCSKAVCNEDRDSWKTQPMRPGLNLPRFLCISFSFLFDTMPLLPKFALVPARPLNPLLFRNETKALCITSLTNRQRLFNRFLMHC